MNSKNWSEYRFSDFVDINPQVNMEKESLYPFIEMKDLNPSFRNVYPSAKRKLTGGSRFLEDDTLFARITPCLENGKICQVKGLENREGFGSTEFLVFRGKRGISEPDFVYYLSKFSEVRQFGIKNLFGTSGRQRVNKEAFNNLILELPPLPEQRAIADVLSALDDKIELNRRMNRTLEQLAQALFKHMFLDNPEREKWEEGKLGDIVDVIDCLHSKKPERVETGKPFLQLNNITDNGLLDTSELFLISEEDYEFWISRIEASPGDCVITNVGRVGAVSQIPEGFHAALGRNMTGLRCKPEYPFPTFLIEVLLSPFMRQEINNKIDTGTILDALNVKNIPFLSLKIPPVTLIQKFELLVRPIRKLMEQNLKESFTLAELRDTLLPKLMSGQLRIRSNYGSIL